MDSHIVFSDNSTENNSGISSIPDVYNTEPPNSSLPELTSLKRLSDNLDTILESSDFSDAKIIVSDSHHVPIHRCILSARSPFFKKLFSTQESGVFELKKLVKDFNVGVESLVGVLGYLYCGKLKPLAKGVCVCVDEECSHVGCRPAVDSMLEVLYASFVFQISELAALYQIRLLAFLDKVATDEILVILSVAKLCDKMCERLLTKCIEIVVMSEIDFITLEKVLSNAPDLVKLIMDSRSEAGLVGSESNSVPDKHVRRIHRALESDDVELVRMLLKEGHTTLDDAYALHFAVAYCDAKTTTELLDFGIADVNLRNPRGYSVLHIAAMRKEPKIIVSLLTKGACPSALTSDGRKALQISKRLTRYSDYHMSTKEGQASPKDRLCIEVLEQAEGREILLGEASIVSIAMAGDNVRMKLLYLENRVSLAKLLFPTEAKVAMDNAQVDGTQEFPLVNTFNSSPSEKSPVKLNVSTYKIEEEHLSRMNALSKTVELGKRFFPRCSEVLNKIMDADDLSELAYLGVENPEERLMKKQRYLELQEILVQAFSEDKEEFNRSAGMSAASCMGVARTGNKFTPTK